MLSFWAARPVMGRPPISSNRAAMASARPIVPLRSSHSRSAKSRNTSACTSAEFALCVTHEQHRERIPEKIMTGRGQLALIWTAANQPVDEDSTEAPIAEMNAIVVMLVEGVHGLYSRRWLAPRRIPP